MNSKKVMNINRIPYLILKNSELHVKWDDYK